MKNYLYFLTFMALVSMACGQTIQPVTPVPAPAIQPSPAPVNNAASAMRLPAATEAGRVYVVSASILTVRSKPSTDATALGYAYEGDELTATGATVDGVGDCTKWAKIRWNGGVGFVCAAFIYPK